MRNLSVVRCILIAVVCIAGCKKPANHVPAKYTGCRINTIVEVPADTLMYPTTTYALKLILAVELS